MFVTRLLRLMRREWTVLISDPRLLAVILLVPIGYTLLLGSIYQPKRVSAIPAWVIDEDNSALSRSVRDGVAHGETFSLVHEGGTVQEFRQATLQGRAFACIIIPKHFEADVKKGRDARLLTLIDGSNMLIANSVLRGAASIGGTFSAGILVKRLSMRGTPGGSVLTAAVPVTSETRVWYNPAFDYLDFLLPGLLAAIIQQVTLLGVALAFTRERERNLTGGILRITDSPLEVLLSKGIFYTLINLITAAAAFAIAVTVFHMSLGGSTGLMASLLVVFIIALVGLGLVVSVVCRDSLFATQVLMLIAVPSFLFSGFTWPQMSMSGWVLGLSNALPLTHFVLPLRQITAQGADMEAVRSHLLWLWTLAGIC
ncbi:MAG: ABC transporter permease, partial [bacterium]|nr:ABC transporter permease [bacterium]